MPFSKACWSAMLSLACFPAAAAMAQQTNPSTPAQLPPVLEKLQLSPAQRIQVEAILRKHDAAFATAWQEFTASYQKTLKAEAFLLTAIEDGFSDTQRKQAQDLRRDAIKVAPPAESKSAASTTESTKAAPGASDKTPPTGVGLTPEQVAAVGKLQEKYHIHLGPMTRDIQACHSRLLAIEMEKFVEIEKVLTPEQTKMLTEMLQSGEAAKISGLKSEETTKK